MNKRVLRIYREVMAVPEGPNHIEARRLTRRYVREMSPDAVQRVLDKQGEIEDKSMEEFFLRKDVLMELGFLEGEAAFFARCRLNSPGIRTLLKERVQVTRHATPEEIDRIKRGDRGTLKGLMTLYAEGGLYAKRKTKRL